VHVPRLLLCALALALPSAALAGTVRMKSGQLVEGQVTDVGDRLIVATESGEVSVRWRDVDLVHKDKTPAALFDGRLAAVDQKDAKALFALALWADKAGLAKQRKDVLAKVLALDPEHEGARKALLQERQDGKWLKGSELLQAKGFVSHDGHWLLREEAEMLARRGAVKQMSTGETRVKELLEKASGGERAQSFALEALQGLSAEDKIRPALRMLRRGEPDGREMAAKVLAMVDDVDVIRPLVYAAIMDRSPKVRAEAVQALVKIDHADTVHPFGKALFAESAAVRMNAAEAIGAIGGAPSVMYLVKRVQTTGGIGTRNHFSSLNQMSYISDFDVEIAQLAQIGDPIVGTLREGVVLDTRVLGVREEYTTIERLVFYRSLRTITGKDIGDDPVAWKKWWDVEGKEAFAAK